MVSPVRVLLIILYICILFICVIGNLLVCLYFTLDSKKFKHIQLLIFYLATFDLLAGVFGPSLFIYLEIYSYKKWHFGDIGCKMLPYLWKVLTSISLGIIMVINIDRCIAICRPFRAEVPKHTVNKIVAFITVLSMLLETPHLVYAETSGDSCQVPFVGSPGYAYAFLTIHCARDALYLTVFIVTYVLIQRDLNQSSLVVHCPNRTAENKTVRKMLIVVAIVFILLTFPRDMLHIVYVFSWLIGPGIARSDILVVVNSTVTVLLSCNRISNAFIYAKLHRRFRKVVRRKVKRVLSFTMRDMTDSGLQTTLNFQLSLLHKDKMKEQSSKDTLNTEVECTYTRHACV